MLVRVSYTRSESMDSAFDEVQNRSTSHLQYEDWAEFMVAWRKDRIEIYEDYVRIFFSTVQERLVLTIIAESPREGMVIRTQTPCLPNPFEIIPYKTVTLFFRRPHFLSNMPTYAGGRNRE